MLSFTATMKKRERGENDGVTYERGWREREKELETLNLYH